MTTVAAVTIQRFGQAIRAALLEHSPDDADLFEAEMRAALVNAAEHLDLAGPAAVLERWHARARWRPTHCRPTNSGSTSAPGSAT